MGGVSAEKLTARGKARADGMSFSRTAKLIIGDKVDLRFIASSGPGEVNGQGLIVPRFNGKAENYVAVSMTLDAFSELILATEAHYKAWLASWYVKQA